jgi:hypothetical protein
MVSEIHHKMEGEEELLEKQHQVYLRLIQIAFNIVFVLTVS